MPSPKDAVRFGCPREEKDGPPPENEGYLASMERQMQSIMCGNTINDVQERLVTMAGQSANEVKNRVSSIASTDTLENVAGRIHSMAGGEDTLQKEEELNRGLETLPDPNHPNPEESNHIDNMDKVKVEEYLRHRHRSSAAMPRSDK